VIVDSSAIVAILRSEPDAKRYADAIEGAHTVRLSAGTFLETGIVIDSLRNPLVSRHLDEVLRDARITIEPVTPRQAQIAREAYRDFGRGSGHAARLNFGDCFAYALAKDIGEPLLYKGNDFSHTDVESALPRPQS
jgi:ribonuclease VapC